MFEIRPDEKRNSEAFDDEGVAIDGMLSLSEGKFGGNGDCTKGNPWLLEFLILAALLGVPNNVWY